MKDAAFTPGPWHVGPHYKSDVESGEGRICECTPMASVRAEVNARFISAAPDLYEALKALLAWSTQEYDSNPVIDAQAHAAIAKAEGRE